MPDIGDGVAVLRRIFGQKIKFLAALADAKTRQLPRLSADLIANCDLILLNPATPPSMAVVVQGMVRVAFDLCSWTNWDSIERYNLDEGLRWSYEQLEEELCYYQQWRDAYIEKASTKLDVVADEVDRAGVVTKELVKTAALPADDEYLTPDKARRLYGVSPATLRKAGADGRVARKDVSGSGSRRKTFVYSERDIKKQPFGTNNN
jgi:hypothetical protein